MGGGEGSGPARGGRGTERGWDQSPRILWWAWGCWAPLPVRVASSRAAGEAGGPPALSNPGSLGCPTQYGTLRDLLEDLLGDFQAPPRFRFSNPGT